MQSNFKCLKGVLAETTDQNGTPQRAPITWFIFSGDGGGIKGVIPATGLIALAKQTNLHTTRWADFMAGTSTLGILVNGLTLPDKCGFPAYTEQQMRQLYIDRGEEIFTTNLLRKGWNLIGGGGEYPAKVIEGILQSYFGKALFRDQLGFVMIPTVRMDLNQPWFRKNWDAVDGLVPTWHVARETSAAPTFFAPAQVGKVGVAWDGGINANSPSLCAMAEVIGFQDPTATPIERRMLPGDDIVVVSFGCGTYNKPYSFNQLSHRGTVGLAVPVIDALMAGQEQITDYVMDRLLRIQLESMGASTKKRRYYRFQCELPEALSAMDNASPQATADRIEIAEKLFGQDQASDLAQLAEAILEEQAHRDSEFGSLWKM